MPQAFSKLFHVPESGVMPESWWKWLNTFLAEHVKLYQGRDFEFRIGPPQRSISQNSWLHMVLAQLAKDFVENGLTRFQIIGPAGDVVEIPVTKDAIKLYYKGLYGPHDENGEVRSTASYDTTEMTYFIEAIREDPLIVQAGIYVPDPQPEKARRYRRVKA